MQINCEHPTIIRNPEFNKYVLKGYHYIYNKGVQVTKLTFKNIQQAINREYCKIPSIAINKGFELKDKTENLPHFIKKITYTEIINGEPVLIKHSRDKYKRIYKIDYDEVNDYILVDINTGHYINVFIQVGCNHCVLCNAKKRSKLSSRLILESKNHDTQPIFITLTYNQLPENQYDLEFQTKEIQNFNKRLRKKFEKYDFKYKYVFVSEYGARHGRLHYHGIIYGIPKELQKLIKVDKKKYGVQYLPKSAIIIESAWQKGFVRCEICRDKAGKYVAKYIGKETDEHKTKCLKSINMGKQEILDNLEDLRESPSTNKIVVNIDGNLTNIPYYEWITNMIFPSIAKQISKEFRDNLIDLYIIFKTHKNYDIHYQILYNTFISHYYDYIRLLDIEDIELENIKVNNINYSDTKYKLYILKKYNYDIEHIKYINNQRQKYIQYSNIVTNYDTNFNSYTQNIKNALVRERETDNQ